MKKLLLTTLAVLSIASCSRQENDLNDNNSHGGVASATILIRGNNTKAPVEQNGTVEENKINLVEVFVFNSDGTPDATTPYISAFNPENNKITFAVDAGNDKKFVVLANMDLTNGTITDYNSLKDQYAKLRINETNSRVISPTGLEMSGEASATIVAGTSNNVVPVRINRIQSKVLAPEFNPALTVDISGDDKVEIFGTEDARNEVITFAFEGYLVNNTREMSDAFFIGNATANPDLDWDLWRTKDLLTGVFDGNGDVMYAFSGEENSSWWLTATAGVSDQVFVHESIPTPTTLNGLNGYDRNSVLSILLKGKLSGNGLTDQIRYWRVNIMKDEVYKINRNSIYRIVIDRIVSKGYGTAEEADKDEDNGGGIVPEDGETGVIVEVTVNPWNLYTQNTDI